MRSFSSGAMRLNMSDKHADFHILKDKLASKCLHKSQTVSAKEERLVRQHKREVRRKAIFFRSAGTVLEVAVVYTRHKRFDKSW